MSKLSTIDVSPILIWLHICIGDNLETFPPSHNPHPIVLPSTSGQCHHWGSPVWHLHYAVSQASWPYKNNSSDKDLLSLHSKIIISRNSLAKARQSIKICLLLDWCWLQFRWTSHQKITRGKRARANEVCVVKMKEGNTSYPKFYPRWCHKNGPINVTPMTYFKNIIAKTCNLKTRLCNPDSFTHIPIS